ncbi:hypothetical protein HDV05_001356, partial [Chytridiales sp. JEL 0842]
MTTPTTTTPESLSALTLPALKSKCKDLGVPVSGKKQDLIDRIVAKLTGAPLPPKRPVEPRAPKAPKKAAGVSSAVSFVDSVDTVGRLDAAEALSGMLVDTSATVVPDAVHGDPNADLGGIPSLNSRSAVSSSTGGHSQDASIRGEAMLVVDSAELTTHFPTLPVQEPLTIETIRVENVNTADDTVVSVSMDCNISAAAVPFATISAVPEGRLVPPLPQVMNTLTVTPPTNSTITNDAVVPSSNTVTPAVSSADVPTPDTATNSAAAAPKKRKYVRKEK